ncbi:MAG TPA: hypothetical protein VME66_08160, partial [Candidatus Acidoferrales bacterium]|nr:hypothetical protein [Candidatus Acidoferrales bacterium]
MQTLNPATRAPRLSWNGSVPRPLAVRPPAAAPVTGPQPALKRLFESITTVNHQGTVIVFGRDASPGSTEIYYNVLDLKVTTLPDDQEWTGFTKLDFPDQLRPAGLGIITLDDAKGNLLAPADAPFSVVSDGQYVCLFQQSARNTLLLSRFMLKRVAGPNGQEPSPVLEPVWEVRFQRSEKQDVPGGTRDSQSYLATDGTPFIEPMIELPMIDGLVDGRFAVTILPNQSGTKKNWQFFAIDDATKRLNLFCFPMDEVGLFDLSEQPLDEEGNIAPDASIALQFSSGGSVVPLRYAGAPSATMYTLNERVESTSGDSLLLKRTARVLVSLPVTKADDTRWISTLDFGLSKDGTLARIADDTTVSTIDPADYALQFAGGTYLTLPNAQSSLSL